MTPSDNDTRVEALIVLTDRLTAAEGPATLCGLYVETDDGTGLARRAAPFRVGGKLAESWP